MGKGFGWGYFGVILGIRGVFRIFAEMGDIKKIEWLGPYSANRDIPYDHVRCLTPFGEGLIEWKGWKDSDSYSLSIGGEYIGEGNNLEEAKDLAYRWMRDKFFELGLFLGLLELDRVSYIVGGPVTGD